MNYLNEAYEKLDHMYKKIKTMKDRFEEIKELFQEADNQIEEMRKHHEEEMIKIFEAIAKRDEDIRQYLERKEHEKIIHLLSDMGNLMDEMFDIRLKLMETRDDLYEGKKS